MGEHDHEHDHEHEHDDGLEHDDERELTEAEAQAEAERLVRKEIALAQIRQYGDPVLRMRADEVEAFDDELRAVAERMIAVMHDAEGVGLAATQIGILRRFFVCTIDGEDRVLVNPSVTPLGKDTEVDSEGCLSLGSVRVPVERAAKVAVEARDAAGEPVSLELEGHPARVVQHELDHLDGTLMLDRTGDESRREALRALRPRLVLSS
ncbi:MAG TPA: peptide deformylase [Gaiella sp.]|jgi:peptide deformylase|nr:peptide deformylase [Gaiella sp.]